MSTKPGIITTLEKRARLNYQVADYLLNDPHCLDGNPLKDKAYEVVLEYFAEKQEESKSSSGGVSYSSRVTIDLQVLIDCYEEEGDEATKKEYARKIAHYVHQTQENWLKRIPDEIKNYAFRIITEYLEEQMRS